MPPFSLPALAPSSSHRPTRPWRSGKRLVTIVVLSAGLLLALATPVVALG